MCLPAAVAAVPALLSAAGGTATVLQGAATAVSTLGAITGGVSAYEQARAAEGMARTQARDALTRGDEAAADLAKEQAVLRGRQRAALAASGVEVDYGSAGKIQDDTTAMQREDQRRLAQNAAREAWGYSVEAAMARASAKGAVVNTVLDAGSTLLAGASKTYASWKTNRKTPQRAQATWGGMGPGA